MGWVGQGKGGRGSIGGGGGFREMLYHLGWSAMGGYVCEKIKIIKNC